MKTHYEATCNGIEQAFANVQSTFETPDNDDGFIRFLFCIREALNNIVEHSEATRFRVQTRRLKEETSELLCFRCCDNGIAFDVPVRQSTPQLSMQGRGWQIIQAWCDGARLKRYDNTNQLTLYKKAGNRAVPTDK